MKKETGGSAFPSIQSRDGMTLRDYFAASAIQGFFTNDDWLKEALKRAKFLNRSFDEYVSKAAYKVADAMLEARKS